MKKKILIIVDGYTPANTYGGPPISIKNFCELMYDTYDFFIITVDHELGEKERLIGIDKGWNKRKEASILYISDDERVKEIKSSINRVNPDLIYINSLFDYRSLLSSIWYSEREIPILIAPRGQLLKGAMSIGRNKKNIYWNIIRKILKYRNNVYFQATSLEEKTILSKSIYENKIVSMQNIPSFEMINHKSKVNSSIGKQLNIVFVSRIVPKKNLLYALRLMKKIHFSVKFSIYGTLEDEIYWNECKREIDTLPTNIDIIYGGELPHSQVKDVFSKNDVFLFPTKSENFGHVISEALFSGCIVLISDTTPWNDLKNFSAGFISPLDKPELFIDYLNQIYNLSPKEYSEYQERIKKYLNIKYNSTAIKESLQNTIEKIMYRG